MYKEDDGGDGTPSREGSKEYRTDEEESDPEYGRKRRAPGPRDAGGKLHFTHEVARSKLMCRYMNRLQAQAVISGLKRT